MGVQYGIATPNLVPSTGNATNAATNSRSLEPYIKTFFFTFGIAVFHLITHTNYAAVILMPNTYIY